jgi:hypothetical protein
VQPTVYRITVRGRLTDRLGSAFEGMALHALDGDTVLVGEVRDQSQLFGLLDTMRALGVELISATPDRPYGPVPSAPPPPTPATEEPPT